MHFTRVKKLVGQLIHLSALLSTHTFSSLTVRPSILFCFPLSIHQTIRPSTHPSNIHPPIHPRTCLHSK